MSKILPSVASVFVADNQANMAYAEFNPNKACLSVDPDIFFPAKETTKQSREAIAVCAKCPTAVRAGCLALALENREQYGIWGGLRTPDRERLLTKSVPRRGLA